MRAYYFTIIYIIVIFTHTQNRFCHIVILSHKRLYAPGGDTLLLLAENPQSASGKYVSLPAKDSFPPAGSKQEKKLSRLTDFYTLAPPAVLYFPRKAVSLYQQTRELEARFSSRPIRRPVPSPSTSLPESFRKLETDRHFCLTKKTG